MAEQIGFDLVPTALAVEAMRDNGYKNAAYAAAELIDNSLQAGATVVELLVREKVQTQGRKKTTLSEVAVLDDGCGMNELVLRQALQFGNGSRLDDRSGMGRFGMGLPSSSISQCRRFDVWSWQDGPENAIYTHVDLDDVKAGGITEVPEPARKQIPEMWLKSGETWGKSGTLVIWSKLDRVTWKTAKTLMRNSEFVVARMYREWLNQGKATIRMAAFEDRQTQSNNEWFATANDPGYLMVPSSTPEPFDTTAMFNVDGDDFEQTIALGDEIHTVKVRFSLAKQEARPNRNAGSMPHGKHARDNLGVSLMRAGRELDLDKTLVIEYDPTERWWGVQVDFPPSLDEVFGVTNNKQDARNFTDLASRWKRKREDASDWKEFQEDVRESEDHRVVLLDLLNHIDSRLVGMRATLKLQAKGQDKARKRHERGSAEAAATAATRERQAKGQQGASDAGEQLPESERLALVTDQLIEDNVPEDAAGVIAAQTIDNNLKYVFVAAEVEGSAFFTVSNKAGVIHIRVNMKHPAYTNLVEVTDPDIAEDADEEELRQRLDRAGRGLQLLLMAWARYEDELPDAQLPEVQDTRAAWGTMARKFLQGN